MLFCEIVRRTKRGGGGSSGWKPKTTAQKTVVDDDKTRLHGKPPPLRDDFSPDVNQARGVALAQLYSLRSPAMCGVRPRSAQLAITLRRSRAAALSKEAYSIIFSALTAAGCGDAAPPSRAAQSVFQRHGFYSGRERDEIVAGQACIRENSAAANKTKTHEKKHG